MKRLFDPDSPIMRLLADLADLVVLNLLWLLCCLPIVTAGAATAALYRCTLNMARTEKAWNAKAFFAAFRENFPKATGIWLILLAVLAVLAADIWLLYRNILPFPRAFSALPGAGTIFWLFTKAFVFPLTAQFENTVGKTLSNAVVLSVSHPIRSLAMCALNLLPLLLWLLSPSAFLCVSVCWLLFGFSLTAYVNTLLIKPVFAPYMQSSTETDPQT